MEGRCDATPLKEEGWEHSLFEGRWRGPILVGGRYNWGFFREDFFDG
jgi:hypothetical protein